MSNEKKADKAINLKFTVKVFAHDPDGAMSAIGGATVDARMPESLSANRDARERLTRTAALKVIGALKVDHAVMDRVVDLAKRTPPAAIPGVPSKEEFGSPSIIQGPPPEKK